MLIEVPYLFLPTCCAQVESWDVMEQFWQQCFFQCDPARSRGQALWFAWFYTTPWLYFLFAFSSPDIFHRQVTELSLSACVVYSETCKPLLVVFTELTACS